MNGDGGRLLTPRLVLGLALIVLGGAFLLDELNLLDVDDLLRWWPLIPIAVGLTMALQPAGAGNRLAGGLLAVGGVWILLYDFGLIDVDFWDAWPLLLIVLGGWIVWRAVTAPDEPAVIAVAAGPPHGAWIDEELSGPAQRPATPPEGTAAAVTDADTLSAFGFLGHIEKTSVSRSFQLADLTAIMGGCTLDLRGADVGPDGAVVDAFAFWGGVEIIVPRDWAVTNKVLPLLGSAQDTTRSVPGAAKQILVRGSAIMGGVEITNGDGD